MTELLALVTSALQGIWRQRWWGLAVAALIGALGSASVMRLPTRYEASARVYVDTQSILQPLLSGLAVQPNVEQQVAMMGRTLLSRPNVERVLSMSGLEAADDATRDQMVDALTRELRFLAVPGGTQNLYTIRYASDQPEKAQRVVESLLKIFVESNVGEKRREAEQARRFIDEQIKSLEQELHASETRLKEFKIRNMALMPNLAGDYLAKSNELQVRLAQARLDLREAEMARDEMKKQLAGETPSFSLAPDAMPSANTRPAGVPSVSEIDIRIETLRKNLDGMMSKYTDEHPDVVGTQRILQQLEAQRDAERKALAARTRAVAASGPPPQRVADNPVYQQLKVSLVESEGQVASLRARVSGLEAQLAQARSSAQAIPRVEAEYTALTRDYEVHKRNYDQLVQRRESARLTGSLEGQAGVAELRVVDPPRVGSAPVSPNLPALLSGVLLLSLAAGIGFAFIKDQFKPVYYDLRGLRSGTEMPILGIVSTVLTGRALWRRRLGNLVFYGTALLYIGSFAGVILHHVSRANSM